MKFKGIVLAVILSLASIMMPFTVYAAVQSSIAPTFSSSTSQWNGHLHITNFSDGTNNQASSTLAFTFDDDYYGIVYFDGYGPSNQLIANYASVYIAGGYGEYRYSYYQNGVINITNVTVNIVNVVKPDSSVDLTQIITLLTAIETDTSSIDNLVDSTLTQIRSVLSQLIISNGYLEQITELRQYHYPIESLSFVSSLYNFGYDVVNNYNFQYWDYPIFQIPRSTESNLFYTTSGAANQKFIFIFYSTLNISDNSLVNRYLSFDNATLETTEQLGIYQFPNGTVYRLVKLTYIINSSYVAKYFKYLGNYYNDVYFIPIYANNSQYNNISLNFAINFGLSNNMLDDIHLIAQGSTQSNSAASDLESNNNQMADDMDDLATIESGYNQQFNNQLQSIDFTSPIQNNAGILPAANFVISIFNGLINNNPFSVLIIIVCILLIGKKVIGK